MNLSFLLIVFALHSGNKYNTKTQSKNTEQAYM